MKEFLVAVLEEYLYFWTDVLPFFIAAILVAATIFGVITLVIFILNRFLL